ncbi:hypothetical protein BGZ63DRAFT_231352 [Mariannaea sp. PMI_226]|nr:hypothetical protein BGZ63DRAFT_231352 [Mariannaea sp. PMI_226]
MRPTFLLPRRDLVLSSLVSVSLLSTAIYAADDKTNTQPSDTSKDTSNKDSSNNDSSNNDSSKNTAPSQDPSSNDSKNTNNPNTAQKTTNNPPPQTTATQNKDPSTNDDKPSTDDSSSETNLAPPKSSTTTTSTTSSDSSSETLPSLSKPDITLTGMPTLTGVYAIPTYPAPSVPPTNNAPFMQHSSAPDGTVFIAVGAILGAFGIAILLWRVIVGFLLHRSVERAAKAQHDANAKSGFPAPPAPFYKYTDNNSTMSLTAGRGVRRTTRGPILSSTPSASNLFFSPTAAASGGAAGNRASAFLPSGFYAAGTSSPGGHHEHSISLTNLRPDSRGQYGGNPSRNTLSATPPDSPSFHARRDMSNTSLNLTRPPSQRAPSAFLDDLLADDPSALPPPHMPGSQRHSSHGSAANLQNRY